MRLYGRLGKGWAVVITSNVMVDRQQREAPRNVVLDETSDMKAFQAWAAAIHGQDQTKNHRPKTFWLVKKTKPNASPRLWVSCRI